MKVLPEPLKFSAIFSLVLLAMFTLALPVFAQTNAVDLSFNAVPDKNPLEPPSFVVQPDNKTIVFGNFQSVNGRLKNQIVRFNEDGSLDNTFNCQICSFVPTNVLLQPDGKILVSGTIATLQSGVYRLNADGSRDESFNSPFDSITYPNSFSAFIDAVQPDGRILITVSSFFSFGGSDYSLYRLNSNGILDTTFTRISVGGGRTSRTIPQKIDVLPDGKILVAANSSGGSSGYNAFLYRLNQDGILDSTFDQPTIIGTNGNTSFRNSLVYDFDIQSDGSFIVVGNFITVNAVSRRNVVKLLPAGNVDTNFNVTNIDGANRVEILPDGKILLGSTNRIYRLNADGSLDNSFASPSNITQIYRWKIDSAGRIVLYGSIVGTGSNFDAFVRLNQSGVAERSFPAGFGIAASVTAIGVQANGKVVFAGDFLRVNGAARTSIVRVNIDGSFDPTFYAGSGFNGVVSKIIVQADGKILVVGDFSSYNGTARPAIARLNADGSLDTNFNLNLAFGSVAALVLQPDGKFLIGGSFNNINGQARSSIARFNADGSLDASFNPTFGNAFIRSIAVQTDGKILVGGAFSGVNGFSRSNLVRLNPDGSVDSAFNAGSIFAVNQVEIQTDGKYLISTGTLLRLNSSGATDTTFLSPTFQSSSSNNPLTQFLAQPDGTILIGGSFNTINNAPRPNLARLRPNGTLDTSFLPSGANAPVRTIVRQTDGRVLVGGEFSVIGGVSRLSIARLNVAPYRLITPFDFDGDSRADVSLFRPSNGSWYLLPSGAGGFYGFPFGQSGDLIAPADYDGDGKTDVAVFRPVVAGAGDQAYFYILNSSDNSFRAVGFGTSGDVPVSGDWDGDGKADLAVYRAASAAGGQSNFYYRPSSQPTVNFYQLPLGTAGDKPVPADYDGDGRIDPAVFRTSNPSAATWIILRSSLNQITQTTFGVATDIPVPADYDGDGQANIAVFRPSAGTWYTSPNAATNYGAIVFGANGDVPVPADYDGDGRADAAIFRPTTGAWYLNRTTSGFTGVAFGTSGDKPAPNAYVR